MAYVTPMVAGITAILFMLKPLFARPAGEPKTVILDPLKEPIFVHFVYKIALAVGAPRPKQIQIDCDVNAAASFHRGIFGFFGNELVLTVGLPLIAGFNACQLAGVLAHEFGHFSQGVGMRFHYLTYKINSWLFHAVYTRDTWDQKLDEAAEQSADWINIILNIARAGVWLTRKILYVFMMTGHAVSSYMLRQMEFDADRYEIFMAGSKQFKDTTLQLQRLGAAFQISHDHLAQAWEEKKLVNDFPSLIAHNASQLSPEIDKAVLRQIEEAKTQVYDSHPSDKQRIKKAMQEQAPGVFNLNCESRELFKSFNYLAKQVTIHHYDNDLGLEFEKDKLVDVNQVVKITRDHEQQQEAYSDYFKEMAPVFAFPLAVNIFDTSKVDWDKLVEQYQEVNDRIANEAVTRNRLMSAVNKAYRKYQIFDTIDLLKQAKVVMLPEWFDLDDENLSKHKAQLEKAEQAWQQLMTQLKPMFELNDQRLSIALTLLNHPKLIGRNREHAHHLKMRNRLSLLINNFKRNTDTIIDFEYKKFRLTALLSCARVIGQKTPELQTLTDQLLEEFKESFARLSGCLHRLDYPFVAEGEHETIAGYLETLLPKRHQCASELEYYLSSGNVIEEKLESTYKRIMSGLAAVALTVDRLLPTMDDEQEPRVEEKQQQVAVSGSMSQQSNLAFKSADYFDQPDVSDSQSDSARAFYEAAVMGSNPAAKPAVVPVNMNPGTQTSDKPAGNTKDQAVGASQTISNLLQKPKQSGQNHTDNQQPQADTSSSYPATGAIWQSEAAANPASNKPATTKDSPAIGSEVVADLGAKDNAGGDIVSKENVNNDSVGKNSEGSNSNNQNNEQSAGANEADGIAPATKDRAQDQVGPKQDEVPAPDIELNKATNLNADTGNMTSGESVADDALPAENREKPDEAQADQVGVKEPYDGESAVATSPTVLQSDNKPADGQPPEPGNNSNEAALSDLPEPIPTTDKSSEPASLPAVAETESQSASPHAMDAMTQSIDNLKKTVNKLKAAPVKMPPATNPAAITPPVTESSSASGEHAEDVTSLGVAPETTTAPDEQQPMESSASDTLQAVDPTSNSTSTNDTTTNDTPREDLSISVTDAGDASEQESQVSDALHDVLQASDALPDIDDEPANLHLQDTGQDNAMSLDPEDMEQEIQLQQVKLDQTVIEVMAELDDLSDELALPTSDLEADLPLDFNDGGRIAGDRETDETQSGLEMAASLEEVINYGQQQTPVDSNSDTVDDPDAVSRQTAGDDARQAAGRITAASESNNGNSPSDSNREAASAADPGSNQRLSEALAKMAEKRNNWRSYLSQVTTTVVEPGLETADRYASIKGDSSADIKSQGDDPQGTDASSVEQSTSGEATAQTASPMADRVLELQRVTQPSVKQDPASSVIPPSVDDNVPSDNNSGDDETPQESPSA
ncbi:MAG: M48 family metalloprotease [Gammaproteobacteria bacterium]